jgi:hypothetical protein
MHESHALFLSHDVPVQTVSLLTGKCLDSAFASCVIVLCPFKTILYLLCPYNMLCCYYMHGNAIGISGLEVAKQKRHL